MTNRLYTCLACARALPVDQFTPTQIRTGNIIVCVHCESLPAPDLVMLTRATVTRDLVHQYTTKAGKRSVQRQEKIARYAETGKRCMDCHEYKPVAEFDICSTRGDGLQSSCRDCKKLYVTLRAQGGLTLWRTVRQAMRDKAALLPDKND